MFCWGEKNEKTEVNILMMAAQLQYHGFITGHAIGYPRYATNPKAEQVGQLKLCLFQQVFWASSFKEP